MRILFLFLFLSSCNRIDFHNRNSKKSAQKVINYEWASELGNCHGLGEDCGTPFLSSSIETAPGYIVEHFIISKRNALEVVFAVDSSDSMNGDLKRAGQNMSALLSHIQDKNWRIAFTTADHGDQGHDRSSQDRWQDYTGSKPYFGKFMRLEYNGRLLPDYILTKETPNYMQVFKETLSREGGECNKPPYCQGFNEQPLRSLKSAIERYNTDPPQKKFFQPNTDTVAIIFSDEDERLRDFRRATIAENIIGTYKTVFKGKRKRLFGFSVSIQDKECLKTARNRFLFLKGSENIANIIGRLAELTGGRNISLCSDYGQSLADLSQRTRSLAQSLTLKKLFYIPESVKVSLTPKQPHISWDLYGRKLVFSDDIQKGTRVEVSYQYEL